MRAQLFAIVFLFSIVPVIAADVCTDIPLPPVIEIGDYVVSGNAYEERFERELRGRVYDRRGDRLYVTTNGVEKFAINEYWMQEVSRFEFLGCTEYRP